MAQLERFDNNGIELVIDLQTGEAFATQAGYARMSGLTQQAVNQRALRHRRKNELVVFKKAKAFTTGGLQTVKLMPIKTVIAWLLEDYTQNPTQKTFDSLFAIYQQQNMDTSTLLSLHTFNAKNKTNLKAKDRERQIQLAYQLKYGGEIEYPTANGRIDLLTENSIYEFKVFKDYKACLGQLLAYDDCIPGLKLLAVLFGVPKSLSFNSSECQRVEKLLNKYSINVEFMR